MVVETRVIKIKSKRESEMVNLTKYIIHEISNSDMRKGIATIFVKGSTGSIIMIEYELELIKDFPDMLGRIIPKNIKDKHDNTWHDGNGHSHVRASLIGPSLKVPFVDGMQCLGTWQQIVFVGHDIRDREREIILQTIGE